MKALRNFVQMILSILNRKNRKLVVIGYNWKNLGSAWTQTYFCEQKNLTFMDCGNDGTCMTMSKRHRTITKLVVILDRN